MNDHCNHSMEQAWRIACKWKTPPQWGTREWREELRSVSNWIGLEAEMTFEPARDGVWDDFLFLQLLSALQTHHRREWRYSFRCCMRLSPNDERAEATSIMQEFDNPQILADIETTEWKITLEQSLDLLNHDDRLLIYSIYFEGCTESEIALRWGVSQSAINQRKRGALRKLRFLLTDGGVNTEKTCPYAL